MKMKIGTFLILSWIGFSPAVCRAWEVGQAYLDRMSLEPQAVGLDAGVGLSLSNQTEQGDLELSVFFSRDKMSSGSQAMDRNVLFLSNWGAGLIDIQADLKTQERYQLWDFGLRYWHQVREGLDVGAGAVLNVLEKQTETTVAYQSSPYMVLITPHLQNISTRETYIIPGIPVGVRLRLPVGDMGAWGNIVLSGEYLIQRGDETDNKLTMQGQPVKSFGGPRIMLGYKIGF